MPKKSWSFINDLLCATKKSKFFVIFSEFYVLLTVHPCMIFFQMKPARFTLFLSIFISTSLHVSGNYVPIIRRTYCIYETLVFFALYGVAVWSADQTSCKHSLVLLRKGEIFARNMSSWLKLSTKFLLLRLVRCLYYCISDTRSHKLQKWI